MTQIQWLSGLLMLIGVISGAVIVIANFKRITLEQYQANNRNWNDAVLALKAHVEALKGRIEDVEDDLKIRDNEIAEQKGQITALEKEKIILERERGQLTRRNIYLYDHCQGLRSQLERFGVSTKEPNGEEET